MPMGRIAPVLNVSPAIKLVAVFAVAIVLQSGFGLVLAGTLSLWALLLHRGRFLKLLRRIRLLILVLFLVTLFMTPGAALFPTWGLVPTEEGLMLAVTQLLRLIGMLAAVSLLLDTTDDRSLAAGSLALLQPLAVQRQWPERAVARLLLVFHYLETAPKPRNLQEVLALAGMEPADSVTSSVSDTFSQVLDAPETIELPDASLTRQDVVVGTAVLVLSLFALMLSPAL